MEEVSARIGIIGTINDIISQNQVKLKDLSKQCNMPTKRLNAILDGSYDPKIKDLINICSAIGAELVIEF